MLTTLLSPLKISLFLFLLALAIRLAAIFYWQFDGLYGQDAYAYFDQAMAITQNLPQGRPPPTDFFWPNGYPLLIAFFTLFAGPTAWAGQLAALLCGAALAPLTFLLSYDLFEANSPVSTRSRYGDILTGLIVAVAGQPILSSVVIMADMPALFWATLAAWLVVRAVRSEQRDRKAEGQARILPPAPLLPRSPAFLFLAAGAALALAIISRWLYVLMAPVLAIYVVYYYMRANTLINDSDSAKASFGPPLGRSNKSQWWPPLLAIVGGVIILAPQLWLSLDKPEGLAHSWLLGWNPANFFQREFENIDGHFVYPLPNWVFYAQPAGHPAYIFPVLGLVSLWDIWRLWKTRQWGSLILLLGWAAPIYLFLSGIPYQNFRFGLSLYPPLVILAGYGLGDLLSKGAGGRRGGGEQNSPLLPCSPTPPRISVSVLTNLAIVLSLTAMLTWTYPMLDSFLTTQNQSKMIARQVEQSLPTKATLITFGLTLTFQHYTRLNTVELFYLDKNSLKALTRSPGPLYLLLDLNSIETQWQGKTPQINYKWLRENRNLREIGAFPPYTLFQLSTPKI